MLLLAEHQRYVLHLAKRWLHWANPYRDHVVSVDDLATEFMLAAFRHLHRFDPSRGSFGGWLAFEARNCACRMQARALRKCLAKVTVGQFAGAGEFDTFAATSDVKQFEPWEIGAEREEGEWWRSTWTELH